MRISSYSKIWIALIFMALVACAVIFSGGLSQRLDQDRQSLLEKAIRDYAVQCYALEGAYPEDIQYLEDHYTLSLDRDKYICHYKFIGSNMMPEISVFEKEQ